MTTTEIMQKLEAMGDAKRLKSYIKYDNRYNGFGVMSGELRKLAKTLGKDHTLALSLWETKNTDAMMLATMMFDEKQITKEQAEQLASDVYYNQTADELVFNTLCKTAFANALEAQWLTVTDELLGRCGWNFSIMKIVGKKSSDYEMDGYLGIIEKDMQSAPYHKQWAMNRALCEMGIRYPHFTDKCLAIGEKHGVFKDVKVSKGCTSPYALAWIGAGIRKRK